MTERCFEASKRSAALALAVATSWLVACAPAAPRGPFFQLAHSPGPGEALVYLLRQDQARTRANLVVQLDGQRLEELRDGEYQVLTVSPGRHRMRLTLKTLWILPSGWNDFSFCVDEGGTAVIRIWTAISEIDTPESRSEGLAVPGRADRRASINAFATRQSLEASREVLKRSQRAPWKTTGFAVGGAREGEEERGDRTRHCEPGRGGGI